MQGHSIDKYLKTFGVVAVASLTLMGAGCSGSGTATADNTTYKDGTYTENISYFTPGGPEALGVSLTLQNGVVTDASVTNNAKGPVAINYQDKFVGAFKSVVVGVKLNDLNLSKVSGASLTTGGFNDAVSKIKAQAAA